MSAVEALDALVKEHLHPALVAEGLRRRGRLWWAGDADSGWILLAVARDPRYNDRDRAEFSIETIVWPVGTWDLVTELAPPAARRERPDVRENAPLAAGPRELLPERYGERDWPWTIQVRPDAGLRDEVLTYCLASALPIARRMLDVDVALRSLTEHPRRWGRLAPVWSLMYACAMLERGAPDHCDFPATVIALRDTWIADPRPDFLRPALRRWCELTGVREPTSHERQAGQPWDASYHGGPAPWDIGRPQPAVVRLAADGAFAGAVLDAGCGTGENALHVASLGLRVAGVDVAETAIAVARENAAARNVDAEFEVADALHLDGAFDTVLDCGLFHTFDADERRKYVASLASVTKRGGTVYVLCFSDVGPDPGPHPVSEAELRAAFTGWNVVSVSAERLENRLQPQGAPAWLAKLERI